MASSSDAEATPVNCGVATVICVTEKAEIRMGDAVVVQGLGLLGLYAAAIAKARGARLVIGIDGVAARRELGRRFGCDHVFDPGAQDDAALVRQVKALCKPEGADAVIEVCGYPSVIPVGIQMLNLCNRLAQRRNTFVALFARIATPISIQQLVVRDDGHLAKHGKQLAQE